MNIFQIIFFAKIWVISMCILRNDAVLRHGYIITSSSNDVNVIQQQNNFTWK